MLNPFKGPNKITELDFSFSGALLSKVPVTGPEKLFYVSRVYIQDRDINSFEIPTIKDNRKRNRMDWFLSQIPDYYSLDLNLEIWLWFRKVNGTFEKEALGLNSV